MTKVLFVYHGKQEALSAQVFCGDTAGDAGNNWGMMREKAADSVIPS